MNNRERELWLLNDEGIYDWWRMSGLSKREFIRQNREELDRTIARMCDGQKPQHYLKYGG